MKLLNLIMLSLVGIAAAAPGLEKRCDDVLMTCKTHDDCCPGLACTGKITGNWVCQPK
ncbi:hypothetical protein ASPWEDRAFT_181952 [Aspergillus wentii DTO 134E9]|uniref:Uncharacterized protein n=1 Tax=Aspergillus wentii DTO 134E9 TaxID=1073089 RepID=A0A1L9RQD1_ASPWE|nr:uncharacterized protein ASPWEDRAFT_181952 [Aspergillus wentii DTO 134E9]KAI9928482.1 hypothetical protein MW887_002527 [Aspergillus wentii]OJJ37028.1 hypothetical protein ASPWEDRAFT_181952 [Aspergillus wentii DTO 134E9]